MGFSETVKTELQNQSLSPSELARRTGYTPQYMHNLIDGSRRWNETTIGKVCEALGLKVSFTKVEEGAVDS